MRNLVVALSALFLSVLLFASGNAFVNSLLGVRLSLLGTSPIHIGMVLVFFSLGFVIGSRYTQPIIQRVGHIRAFAVFSAVIAITALAYPMIPSLPIWAGLRFVSGIAAAGLLITVESWFSCIATEQNRSTLFATYQICFYSAVTAGQLLIPIAPPESAIPFSLAAMLLVASLIPLAASRMHSPSMEAVESLPLRVLFRVSPVGIVATFTNGILISSFYSLGPVYTTTSGLSLEQTSVFMAASIFAAMVMAWPIGHFCDHHNRNKVMLGVAFTAAVFSGAALLTLPYGFPLMCTLTALSFGLTASLYAIGVAITNDHMSSGQIVSASATLLMSYGIGSLIGPLLTSGLMTITTGNSFYVVNICLLLLLVLFIIREQRRAPVLAVEEQEDYVTVLPGITQAINEIDPRNADYDESSNNLEEVFADYDETVQTSSGT